MRSPHVTGGCAMSARSAGGEGARSDELVQAASAASASAERRHRIVTPRAYDRQRADAPRLTAGRACDDIRKVKRKDIRSLFAALLAASILLFAGFARSETPAPSASAAAAIGDAIVRLHDRKVFEIRAPRGGQTASARAKAATRLLEAALEEKELGEVKVDEQGEVAVVYLGKSPVVQLGPEDVSAAGAPTLRVYAEEVAARVREAASGERKRKAAASTVFSVSLLVFSALLALLLARKVDELLDRGRTFVVDHPEKTPRLRLLGIEVVSPAALQGAISLALGAARVLAIVGIGYGWLLFALSLFDFTRGYTEALSRAVVGPLGGLASRLAGGVPLLVVGAACVFLLLLALRFAELFFRGLARGDTTLSWVPRDVAGPTGFLVRGAMVVGALVVGVPLVTGSSDGSLARAGVVALAAIGLAATPLLATVTVGATIVFGRRVQPGEIVEMGGRAGRVLAISLLETKLADGAGGEMRVPHLLTLLHPTHVKKGGPRAHATVIVDSAREHEAVRVVLSDAASEIGVEPTVELESLDADGARWNVSIRPPAGETPRALLPVLATALAKAGIPLGRARRS